MGRLSRRVLAALVAVAAIGGPLAYAAQPSGADTLPPVSDPGLTLQVAQATVSSTGATTITWQNAATINPTKDTLVRAQFFNDGTIGHLSPTMTTTRAGRL